MTKSRLEAFSDGVVAIVITILVLEINIPNQPTLESLLSIKGLLFAYSASFIFVAVIWVSHHRMFQLAEKINYRVVWANIFWLFWLTLFPSVTKWVGNNPSAFWPELTYVLVYTMWSVSYGMLTKQVKYANRSESKVYRILSLDPRGKLSMVINLLVLAAVFFVPIIGILGRFVVSSLWVLSYEKAATLFSKKQSVS